MLTDEQLGRQQAEPATPYQRKWARSSTPWFGKRLPRSSRPASTLNRIHSANSK